MALTGLRYCGTQPVPDNGQEIRLFCVVQNEALRLPHFLAYYRKLGVARFFFVDNNSTDGTAALLQDQADIHVFHTKDSFAEAHFGVHWHNQLLKAYGSGHWCVIVDADELLVYPDCEHIVLDQFCGSLAQKGYAAMQAILLDMYSDKPMAAIGYQAGQDLIQACPYFDRHYTMVRRISVPWQAEPFPPHEPIGGPRSRLFFPRQYYSTPWQRWMIKALFRSFKPLADHGWVHSHQMPHPAPQLFKIPLVQWHADYTMITPHRMNKIALAPTTGALLHFKFLDDFPARTPAAIKHGQHYGGSIEYQRYDSLLQKQPDLTFVYEGSARYTSSKDLEQYGIIRRNAD